MKYQLQGGLFDGITVDSPALLEQISFISASNDGFDLPTNGIDVSYDNVKNILPMPILKESIYINTGVSPEEYVNVEKIGWILRHIGYDGKPILT